MKTYTTISGDEWDSVCFKYYGTEMVMDRVIQANLRHMNIVVFPAGVILEMPEIDTIKGMENKPPWVR